MPHKFNQPRRHKIPTTKYRVTNWPDYDAALVRRGALTVWFTDEAIAEWRAPATGRRGGQPIYSALAIETALTIRSLFHQPLRQTEGLLRSIADMLDIDIAIPDHTTLSRRGVGLTVLPRDIHRTEPLHLVVDSTGLKIYGEGEWLDAKHGSRSRRRWRKLHIGINADTHDVVVAELTPDDGGDASTVTGLLEQVDSRVASLTAGRWCGGLRCCGQTTSSGCGYHPAACNSNCERGGDELARPAYCDDCAPWSNRLAASIGLQSKEPG